MSQKQLVNRSRQKSFDIAFHNRILAVNNMKTIVNICKQILDSPEHKLNLSLEQILKVRNDYKYATQKIKKYITKSRNHPDVQILQTLADI